MTVCVMGQAAPAIDEFADEVVSAELMAGRERDDLDDEFDEAKPQAVGVAPASALTLGCSWAIGSQLVIASPTYKLSSIAT